MPQVRKLVNWRNWWERTGEERRSQKEKWWWGAAGMLWSIVLVLLPSFSSNKSFHQLYYTPLLLGEFPSGVMLLPHILAHLAHRWVQWGRWGNGRDKGGAGAGGCAELDGGGELPSIAWGGSVGAVVWGIPPFFQHYLVFAYIFSFLFSVLVFKFDPCDRSHFFRV